MSETVLVADPAAHTAALIARHLERAGYRVVTAASGPQALAAIDAHRPDACVLEVMLGGGLNGYELVRQLRTVDSVPVVLMSARAGKLDRDFAFTVGANDYFRKPFRCSELIDRLGQLAPAPRPYVVARPARSRGCRPRPAIALAGR